MKAKCKLWMLLLVPVAASSQNVGVGVISPAGTLDVARGTALHGTALFRGTTHFSHFNYGTFEDTYIRGGKSGSHVIINDATDLGNVGIGLGNPAAKLHIYGLSSELVRLQGVSPYLSLHTNTMATGYIQAFGSDLLIGTYFGNENGALRFYNNNVNHMTILANGNIGIGTSTPESRLHIQSEDASAPYVFHAENTSSSSSYVIAVKGTSAPAEYGIGGSFTGGYIGVEGNVVSSGSNDYSGVYGTCSGGSGTNYGVYGSANGSGIVYGVYGAASGSGTAYAVYANGNLAYTGLLINTSDRRLKTDISTVRNALDLVMQLTPRKYSYVREKFPDMNLPRGVHFGFIAQEIETVVPELVIKNAYAVWPDNNSTGKTDTMSGVNYVELIPILTSAIQEQQEVIQSLEDRVTELAYLLSHSSGK